MLNEFRNSHLQRILNHIPKAGSQANAAGAATNSQQAKVMASSSHNVRQGEKRRPPVSRTGESRCLAISGQKITPDVIFKHIVVPTSHQVQSPL